MFFRSKNAKPLKNRNNILWLKHTLVRTIREKTPVDTGNLQKNATYCYDTNYGFNVTINSTYAHYVKYVNEPSSNRMERSQKVQNNAHYVDRAVTECLDIINQFNKQNYDVLTKKRTTLKPLFTTSNYMDKVKLDAMKGFIADGFGTYYKMNKRLTRSMLLSEEIDETEIDEDFDFEESGD